MDDCSCAEEKMDGCFDFDCLAGMNVGQRKLGVVETGNYFQTEKGGVDSSC